LLYAKISILQTTLIVDTILYGAFKLRQLINQYMPWEELVETVGVLEAYAL